MLVENGVVVGNVYDKYNTRNPIARLLMSGFLTAVEKLIASIGATEIHEVGCGEGFLSLRLSEKPERRIRGTDISHAMIERANQQAAAAGRSVEFSVRQMKDLRPEVDGAQLVVCCEVLEHVEGPDEALDVLAELADPYLIASVPREPLWRVLNVARGKYWGDLGNTPGHVNHWSRDGFLKFLARRFEILEVRSPLPWTVVLARIR